MNEVLAATLMQSNANNCNYLQGDQAAEDDGNLYLHLRSRLFRATSAVNSTNAKGQFILWDRRAGIGGLLSLDPDFKLFKLNQIN